MGSEANAFPQIVDEVRQLDPAKADARGKELLKKL
jgi:hypothetical protein